MPESRGRTSEDTQAALKRNRSLAAFAAAILVGGAVAAVAFLPGLTVDAEGTIDPSSPYPISFKIADANFIPLNTGSSQFFMLALESAMVAWLCTVFAWKKGELL